MNKIKQETLSEYTALLENRTAAYDRLNSLFDEGTFVETGRFVKSATTEFDTAPGNEFEGVVTGYGAVDGRLVFAYAQDLSKMKGAMSEAHAKKIVAIYDAALKTGAPVVGILDSTGAKVLEGVGALTGYGAIMKASAKASGIIPQITIVAGSCTGSLATIASMADITIGAEESGKYYVNSPIALKAKGMENAGSMLVAAENGSVALTAACAGCAIAKAKKIISLRYTTRPPQTHASQIHCQSCHKAEDRHTSANGGTFHRSRHMGRVFPTSAYLLPGGFGSIQGQHWVAHPGMHPPPR